MGNSGYRHVALFRQGIDKLIRATVELRKGGNRLTANRTLGIEGIHELGIIGGHPEPKQGLGLLTGEPLVVRESNHSPEVFRIAQTIA